MGKEVLVGSTGLVGQNLLQQHDFDIAVHSTNVSEAFVDDCELVVYAGVPGTKYLANRDPERDFAVVKAARDNLRKIDANKVVLISTVDVYGVSIGKTELDAPGGSGLTSYGANRLQLEEWVREDFPDASIIRLPAIYGEGLKKNFVHDMIHPAPPMLDAEKYYELASRSDLVRMGYEDAGNGFYIRTRGLGNSAEASVDCGSLDSWFSKQEFNALSFTDSRARFQFFDLAGLWSCIQWVLDLQIELLNVATPPVSAGEVYRFIFGDNWINHTDKPIPDYDMRTIYGNDQVAAPGYLQTLDAELEDIKRFVLGV